MAAGYMEQRLSLRPARPALALLALACASLTLGGCSDGPKVAELEKRIDAVEAKADAADKKARAAQAATMNAPGTPPAAEVAGNNDGVGPPEPADAEPDVPAEPLDGPQPDAEPAVAPGHV